MAPKQTDPQFKLRMTPEIKEAIEAAAKANNRSMNAEILSRLERSFDKSYSAETSMDSNRFAESFIKKLTEEYQFSGIGAINESKIIQITLKKK